MSLIKFTLPILASITISVQAIEVTEADTEQLQEAYRKCVAQDSEPTIDLSNQFEATGDQRGGSCATYSASALYGAALFRNDPDFSVLSSNADPIPANIDEGVVILHKLTSEAGPLMDLKNVAALMNSVNGDCTQVVKNSAAFSFPVIQKVMDGNGDNYKNGLFPLEYLLAHGETIHLQDSSTSSESSGEALIEFVTALVHVCTLRKEGTQSTVEDIQRMLRTRLQARKGRRIREITSAYEDFELYRESAHDNSDFDAGDLSPNADGKMQCGTTESAKKFLKRRIKNIRAMLCAGIPMESSVNMENLSYESSKDGGKTWARKTQEEFYVHAMVITGLDADKIVFRNSWIEGDTDIPAKSQLRIPFSEACRLSNIAAIVGDKDRSRISTIDFAVPISQDEGGLPLGFRVSKPREDNDTSP